MIYKWIYPILWSFIASVFIYAFVLWSESGVWTLSWQTSMSLLVSGAILVYNYLLRRENDKLWHETIRLALGLEVTLDMLKTLHKKVYGTDTISLHDIRTTVKKIKEEQLSDILSEEKEKRNTQ